MYDGWAGCGWLSDGFGGELELSGRALGSEAFCQVDGGSGAGGDSGDGRESGQSEEAGGVVEAETEAQLTGGGAQDAAAEGWVEGAEAVQFDGYGGCSEGGGDGAATAADGFAGEEQLREDAGELGLPAGFFFAGQLGEVA